MNIRSNKGDEFIHLYNPIQEGWGSYDINYKNALKKRRQKHEANNRCNSNKRYAA